MTVCSAWKLCWRNARRGLACAKMSTKGVHMVTEQEIENKEEELSDAQQQCHELRRFKIPHLEEELGQLRAQFDAEQADLQDPEAYEMVSDD